MMKGNSEMSEKKKKTASQKLTSSLSFIVFALIGAAMGGVTIFFEEKIFGEDPTAMQSFMFLLGGFVLMVISFIPHVIVHEAGHLVGGLLSGYKFISFRIMNLMLIKLDGKLRFKSYSLAGTGGQCLMSPPEMKDGKLPVFLYNLGGSLMNLIFSGILVFIAVLVRDNAIASYVLITLSLLGFAFALTNGIPINSGLVTNDGYNALKLSGNKAALRGFWIQMKMNKMLVYGKGMSDMPQEWFEIPSDEEMKNAMIAPLGVFGCGYLMEKGEYEKAESTIEHLLSIESGIAGVHRSLMICDRIYLRLVAGDNDTASQLYDNDLKKFIQSMKSFPQVIRTEYTIALLLEKDSKKAEECKKRMEKVEKNYPYPLDVQLERSYMDKARESQQNISLT